MSDVEPVEFEPDETLGGTFALDKEKLGLDPEEPIIGPGEEPEEGAE